MGKRITWLSGIIFTAIGYSYIFLLFLSMIPVVCGYRNYVVVSGSMEPEIPVGSCIYVKKAALHDIFPGDIITFCLPDSSAVVTHRVIKCDVQASYFQTKGDANDSADGNMVHYGQIIGTVRFCIPLIGYFLAVHNVPGMKFFGIALVLGIVFRQMYQEEMKYLPAGVAEKG